MRIIEKVSEMQQQADAWRREGKGSPWCPPWAICTQDIDFDAESPESCRCCGDEYLCNPIQFGPGEDFERYPRDMDRDVRLAKESRRRCRFFTLDGRHVPRGISNPHRSHGSDAPPCGKSRSGHFQGVTTVVGKLFHIVKPHTAIFGEIDFQQLVAIRRMVKDLNMDIEILGHPIVREEDGLAMSSRNVYLNSEQRRNALRLSQSLRKAQTLVRQGERNSAAVLARVRNILEAGKDMRVDYAEMRHPETLREAPQIEGPTLLALAVFVGATRLIDNCVLNASA